MVDQKTRVALERRLDRPLTEADAHGNLQEDGRRDKRGVLRARRGVTEGALSAAGRARLAAQRAADSSFKVVYTFDGYAFPSLASLVQFMKAQDQTAAQAAQAVAAAAPCAHANAIPPTDSEDATPIFYKRCGVRPCARCGADWFSEHCPCCRAQQGKPDACGHCLGLLKKPSELPQAH